MKNIHALRMLSVIGVGSLIASSSFAQQNDAYYYGGISAGRARALLDESRIQGSVTLGGTANATASTDERHTAYKAFGGYQFNRYFGTEAGYFNLGNVGISTTTVPAGNFDGVVKVEGFNLDVVGTWPLTEALSLTGRIGAQNARTRGTFTGTGAVNVTQPDTVKRDTNYKVGLGVQYAFSPAFMIRADAERYQVNDSVGNRSPINLFTASLVFPFGRTAAPADRPAAALPAYVAPAPTQVVAAAPIAAPVAEPLKPVALQRVSLSAESLFTFDNSVVGAVGRTALDNFTRQLEGTDYQTITVEGHTDRLGSTAYNESLSRQRASSVKTYLLTSGKFDPMKISTVAKGESEPITKPTDCSGVKATASLITCLQPDRRVDIEVSGLR